MPLGRGIVEVLQAIPPRIEMTGHGPTFRITAGSFDDALEYARDRFVDPAVLDCEVRDRFWRRVSLTVTTDPAQAASGPSLQELRDRAARGPADFRWSRGRGRRAALAAHRDEPEAETVEPGLAILEEIFAHQEQQRQERARIPTQRGGV